MLIEGVYDKWIFKAIFLAGGSGSGKSTARKLLLPNFKSMDTDELSMLKLRKEKIPPDYKKRSEKEEKRYIEIHHEAFDTMYNKKQKSILTGRLPIVIDRTGASYPSLAEQKKELEDLGYETKMIFIDTPLDLAQKRNLERERKMDPKAVESFHKRTRENVDKFRHLFGSDFIIIDGSKPFAEMKSELDAMYKKIAKWMRVPVKNAKAEAWRKEEIRKKGEKIQKGVGNLKNEIKTVDRRVDR